MSGGYGFGNADDGADWLLAQLANGRTPERAEPPVAPPPASPASAQAPPSSPATPPVRTPAPRREEVLDWFSLAEPTSATDAPTRALPVIGAPQAAQPHEPAQPPIAAPADPPAAQQPSFPSWTPPFAVSRPAAPVEPASVHLTSVEPPVGTPPAAAAPFPPASVPPATPFPPAAAPTPFPPAAAPNPPVAPAPPATPPGPVTPTAPFALTWGDNNELASEESLRAAFRALSDPAGSAPAAPASPPLPPTAAPLPPASAPLPPAVTPSAAPLPPVEPDASPFADFSPPPVARQSFTPMQPEPPRHPTTPESAPPSWGERQARATPSIPNYDQELWAALNEPDPNAGAAAAAPSASFPQPQAPARPAPAPTPAPAEPTAPRDRFAAFAAEATDPFAALDAGRAPRNAAPVDASTAAAAHQAPAAPSAATTPAAPAPPAAAPAPPFAAPLSAPRPPSVDSTSMRAQQTGLPFIEVRGDAQSPLAQPVGAPWREASANARTPFPAFASNGGDDAPADPTREPPEPVDDLLASLGGGAPRSRDVVPPAAGGGRPPSTPVSNGLDALGLGFDAGSDDDHDDGADGHDERRGGLFSPSASARDGITGDDDDSAIAREIAETGYFWNLTPDPTAEDPKANAEVTTVGIERPVPFGAPDAFAPGAPIEPEPAPPAQWGTPPTSAEPVPEPGPEPEPEWSFGADQTAMFPAQPDAATQAYPAAEPWATPQQSDPWSSAQQGDAWSHPQQDDPWSQPQQPAAPRDVSDHTDPLAALFGGAAPGGAAAGGAATAGPGAAAAAAANDPFAPTAAAGAAATSGRAPTPDWRIAPAGSAAGSPTTDRYSAPLAAPSAQTAGSRNGGASGPGGGGSGGGSKPGGNRTLKTLIWVAGGLVTLLVLAGLFYFGTQLTRGGDASPSADGTPSVAEDTPAPAPTAIQPAGVHAWNTLFGGECVEPFESVWAEQFTVVDCASPHGAQLVYRGILAGDPAAPFPGEAELGTQMAALCRADGVIDTAAASAIPDLQVQGSFPVTEEQWAAGERTYYCFVNRAGGEPITGSLQGPGPAV